MDPLRVIGALVLSDRGLLLVSKRAALDVFYLPGGKPDAGETALACLQRELREELGVEIVSAEPFAEVRARAALEGVAMHMSVFLARVSGIPTRAAEIARLVWWPERSDVELAPAVRDIVIPRLTAAGHLTVPGGVIVRRVPAASTARLRAEVLRPGQGVGAVTKADDDHPDTWFFAALGADDRVLSTVNVRPAAPAWDPAGSGWWQLRGMATADDARGRGYARAVTEAALDHVDGVRGRLWCSARTSVVGFYERLGFWAVSEPMTDAVSGPHQPLVRAPSIHLS